jgi:hypothetical protein
MTAHIMRQQICVKQFTPECEMKADIIKSTGKKQRALGLPIAATLVLCACSSLASAKDAPANPDPAITPNKGSIKLFNGESLNGLYTWLQDSKYDDDRGVFQVVDGILCISGDGMGAVVTRNDYRDYHLVLEYRWGARTWREREKAARDSGLLIHSTGAEGGYNGIWMPSLEVQIIEGGVGDFIMVGGPDESGKPVPMSLACEIERITHDEVKWQRGAPRVEYNSPRCPRINWFARDPEWKDVRGIRGKHDPDSPGEQWTRLDVICDGGQVQTFVNGVMVNEAFDVTPRAGKLQLQSELAEILVRRWELWPLNDAPRPKPAEN